MKKKNKSFKPSILFVIPFLNEEENLKNYPNRIKEVQLKINAECFFLFVDDGSTDSSLDIVRSWNTKNVGFISFSKNYGSHYALLAAIDYCDKDFFTFMSADMQEPINLYEEFFKKASSSPVEILLAMRLNRATGKFNKLFSFAYNSLVKAFAFKDFPSKGVDIVFISKQVVNCIKEINEKNTSFYGLLFTLGFKKELVPYYQVERKIGISKWSFGKKMKLLVDTFVSFTLFPLRLISYTGIFLFSLSLLFGIYLIIRTIVFGISVPGYVTLALIVTLGFGCNFLFLGIFSEYLWRLVDQIRPRQRYIVRESRLP